MSWEHQRQRRRQADEEVLRELERRRRTGEPMQALTAADGKTNARSFWGRSWCLHLESLSDYLNRLPRARSTLKQGRVYDLRVTPGEVTASVAGADLYDVRIEIRRLDDDRWHQLRGAIDGRIDNLIDLLAGNLGEGVLREVIDPRHGLLPQPEEIRCHCNCLDWADLCQHAAAVLYGVGWQLDHRPEWLFELRGVDHRELAADATGSVARFVEPPASPAASARGLTPDRLADLFGIDLADPESAFGEVGGSVNR